MPDLNFQVDGAEPQRFAAEPLLLFKIRVTEALPSTARPTTIHSVALRSQIRIEPARRRYADHEKARLLDLFGTPERWGQTVRPMLWTHAGATVGPFTKETTVELPVPCSYDFGLAATKYFDALDGGEIPLCFLFSGTVYYETDGDSLQIAQIPWEKEADFRLPASTWRALMDLHYPNSASLRLRKDVFDRLSRYRSRQGLPTWEGALERLLTAAGEPISS
jgi:hypothetical protein